MTPQEIPNILATLFGDRAQALAPGSYQIEQDGFRLLVLLSDDQTWLRMLVPIAPAVEAQAFLQELLEANFDETQETRYAIQQDVLWAVFHHACESLVPEDFKAAIQRLIILFQDGFNTVFNTFIEKQVRQIIRAAKLQGQTMEATLQTLEHFYTEGVMGDLEDSEAAKQQTLAAWRYQLERLWPEVDP
ncbi:hypothetical protein ACN4EG_04460 [Alkalinema pantanalense CENA528]|uniref:hypothetical protein n=1 Tax=Alkalinema pantanalense TaxID=1620705 RepID=UPI003D6ED41B